MHAAHGCSQSRTGCSRIAVLVATLVKTTLTLGHDSEVLGFPLPYSDDAVGRPPAEFIFDIEQQSESKPFLLELFQKGVVIALSR